MDNTNYFRVTAQSKMWPTIKDRNKKITETSVTSQKPNCLRASQLEIYKLGLGAERGTAKNRPS